MAQPSKYDALRAMREARFKARTEGSLADWTRIINRPKVAAEVREKTATIPVEKPKLKKAKKRKGRR